MKYLAIIICVIWLALHYYAHHIYKLKAWKVKECDNIGWVLGSIVGALTDAFAWYWVYKLIEL